MYDVFESFHDENRPHPGNISEGGLLGGQPKADCTWGQAWLSLALS